MREVKVIWEDAKSYANEWVDKETASQFEPELVGTRGYVVYESRKKIIISQSSTQANGCHNCMVIPRGCVKKIIKEG